MHIGRRIKQLREAIGMQQKELADKSTYTQGYISELERSEDCRVKTLSTICDALNISLSDFFNDDKLYELTDSNAFRSNKLADLVKEIGIDYLVLSKELKESGISPEELRKTISDLKSLGLLNN